MPSTCQLQYARLCCCCCPVAKLCVTLCHLVDCKMKASLSSTISQSLLKFMAVELVVLTNHLIFCLSPLLPPSIFPSIRVFSNKLAPRIRWPEYWSFSFSISPSNEYAGLLSFRIEWFDLSVPIQGLVQGTLKSLLQHHSRKHQFFGAQLPFWSNSHIHT